MACLDEPVIAGHPSSSEHGQHNRRRRSSNKRVFIADEHPAKLRKAQPAYEQDITHIGVKHGKHQRVQAVARCKQGAKVLVSVLQLQ